MVAVGAWAWAEGQGVRWVSKWTLPWGPGHFELLLLLVSEVAESSSVSHSSAVCTGEGQSPWQSEGSQRIHSIFSGSSPVWGDLVISGV